MIASDTTLFRNLSNNLDPAEVSELNFEIAKKIPKLLIG